MTPEQVALCLHDSELEVTLYYLKRVDGATRVVMAEGLARRWANELSAVPPRPGRRDTATGRGSQEVGCDD
ncbi:MAG TPA: hypothetical protein VFQ09_00395 [Rubrobacter sp.]|nr:hypothetical protein [Rubrobacter sp.]